MGRSFKGHGTETTRYVERDAARSSRRSARESWLERGAYFGGIEIPRSANGEGTKRYGGGNGGAK